jgi:hypothetical protein
VKAELANPMQIGWGSANNAVGDSTLTLAVSSLNLADWKPFVGDAAPAGMVNVKARLLSQQGGKQLTFDFDSGIDHLTVNAGSNHITDAAITLQASGKATDLKQFNLTSYKFEVAQQNQTLVSVSGSGAYDKASEAADMQIAAKAILAPLLQALPQPTMSVSSGTVDLKAHFTQKQKTQAVTGNLALTDFTGQFGKNAVRGLGTTADFDVAITPQQFQLRKAAGTLTQDAKPGGTFDFTATYDLTNKTASLTAKLADINQNGVGQFLEPMLADKKLVSVAINGNASAQYDPKGASALKADLQVTNLVVKDPKGQFPATPLEARMQVDASVQKQVADVRQFQVTLTPTARATNQVQLSGQVDMSQTNAYQGSLKLAADSLDLTSYYDLFMGQKQATGKGTTTAASQTTPAAATSSASGRAEKEPDAIKLPLRNFTVEANIRRFYVHEMEIDDWQATTKIDGGHVVVNPFKLTLNGAPVNSTVDMDLGVPGWKYDVSLSAQAIPLAPLVNSFQPERKGQIGGMVTAQGHVSGAGITGASLQKNLAGQFDMNMTNLNLSVINIKSPVLKTLVNVVAGIPELVKNPTGTATSLIGGLLGKAGTSGGLADDLQRSPIDSIVAKGTAGTGVVTLQQATVQSTAFQANATGTITLASVLNNSALQIPVSVSLSQPIAQKLALASSTTTTNTTYVKLPDFFTMQGTVGAPKSKIDYLALAGTMGKSVTGAVQGLGGNVGGVLGNVLGSTSSTNQSGSKASGLLQGILGNSTTTATNAPATTNQSPVKNLLKGFLGK